MASKPAIISEFLSTTLPATWNWKEDSQPERHNNPREYIALAKDLTPASLKFAASILSAAGYIKAEDEDKIVEKLQKLKPKQLLTLNGVSITWRVKSETASNDKILKDGKKSDDIGDYFGLKFVAEDVEDVIRLRNATLNTTNISSRKCEFTYPSERGYRSHKSHHMISDSGRTLSIEAMITHADFERSENLTHMLMESERRILKRMFNQTDPKLSRKFAACAEGLKDQRTQINHDTAAEAGLNALCAPDAMISCERSHIDNWARKITNQVTSSNKTFATAVSNSNEDGRYLQRNMA